MSQLMNNLISTLKVISNLNRVIAPWLIVLKSFDLLKRLVEETSVKIFIGLHEVECGESQRAAQLLVMKQWHMPFMKDWRNDWVNDWGT